MTLFRFYDTSRDGWWDCLRCRRYFTRDPADVFCPDCLREMRDDVSSRSRS